MTCTIFRNLFLLPAVLITGASASMAQESRSPLAAKEKFQQLDRDQNEILSEEEFLAFRPVTSETPLTADQLRQRFRVFDLDRNQSLSLAEFLTIPGVVDPAERGPLPDPLTEQIQKEITRLRQQLPVPISAEEAGTAWQGVLPNSVPTMASLWDTNGDGQLDAEDVRRGLEMAFGLRRPDGLPARQSNGFVFNGSYFDHLDTNGDRLLSRTELMKNYHLGQEAAMEFLQNADRNRDQQLDLGELDAAGLFQTDVPGEFLKWDRNFDGNISPEELEQGAAWQRHLAPHMLPAFDDDQDGVLSLQEYQCCPLGNPLFNWTSQRRDRNGNGTLELEEFFSASALCSSGLSGLYFQRLDRNADGHLDLREFRYAVDPGKLSASQLLSLYDHDGDQKISLLELVTPLGKPLPASADVLLIPEHAEQFDEADLNRDGFLWPQELTAAPELFFIAETEARLRREVLPRFGVLDQNQDHQLSLDEWNSQNDTEKTGDRNQAFRLADVDRSSGISFAEFCAMPCIHDVSLRPWVADPVRDQQRAIFAAIRKDWPQQVPSLSASDLVQRMGRHSPSFSEADLTGWDLNRDGAFDPAEVQFGLQKYFAIKTPSGEWLRRSNGQVFNRRTVHDADIDHDQMLSREEFFARYWKQGAEAEAAFQAADFNRDGRLSQSELLKSQLFWVDLQQEFLRFDEDRDGQISRQELLEQSRPYEKRMAQLTFPLFDLDRDQFLSFHEFRLTPLANPVHDYESRRWDLDNDGKLSLLEFHRDARGSRWGIGLSELFFRILDQDRDQSLGFVEMKSSANLKRLPVDAVFERLDTNGDGELRLDELLAREQPRHQSAWAKRNSEQRSMEIEDAFLAADVDRSRSLSLAEFQSKNSSIRDVVLGVSLRPAPHAEAPLADSSSAGSRWRTMLFVAANVCLFLGIGFWQLRRSRHP